MIKRFARQRGAVIASIVLLALALLCLAAPLFPFDGFTSHLDQRWLAPSWQHPLGTDELGRDFFARVLSAGRISLFVGIAAAFASLVIGIAVGLCAGYYRGATDEVLMRFVDLISSVPWMVLVIVATVFLRPSLLTIIVIIGALSWMDTARLVRAEALSVRERSYVGYAGYIGERSPLVIVRHVLPAAIPTVIVAATATVSAAMMTESALSFLGLGVQAPLASWGSLLNAAQGSLAQNPRLAIVPGLLIAVTVFCVNAVGNGLRAAALREDER